MPLLDDLRREVRQKGERIARAAVIQMQGELKQTSPVDTGLLKSKTTVRVQSVGDQIIAEALADTPYAVYVIRGVKPGMRQIRTGKPFFHRGNPPNPYWENHVQRWGSYLRQAAGRLR